MHSDKGIHCIKMPLMGNPLEFVNCYVIESSIGAIVIDPGWEQADSYENFLSGIKAFGIRINDIKAVIATHAHPDHYGLIGKNLRREQRRFLCTCL